MKREKRYFGQRLFFNGTHLRAKKKQQNNGRHKSQVNGIKRSVARMGYEEEQFCVRLSMCEEQIGLKQCLKTKPKGVPYYSSECDIEHPVSRL